MNIKPLLPLTLLVLGFSLIVTWATEGPSRPTPKRQLVKEDIENMMVSLSNWDRWGKDDQLGTLNLITAAKRKQAAALVQDGTAVSLARNVIKVRLDGSAPFVHTMIETVCELACVLHKLLLKVAYQSIHALSAWVFQLPPDQCHLLHPR